MFKMFLRSYKPREIERAAFNVLVQWHGLQPTASGFVPLSMAEFSL